MNNTEHLTGRLLIELKDGQLTVFSVADTDESAERLLKAISERLLLTDLTEFAGVREIKTAKSRSQRENRVE